MSASTPDQKGNAAPASAATAGDSQPVPKPSDGAPAAASTQSPAPDDSSSRQLNANAKSFQPRQESTTSPPAQATPSKFSKQKTSTKEGSPQKNNNGNNQYSQQQQTYGMPQTYGAGYGMQAGPISPLTALAMPPGMAGMPAGFNPMLMSPLMVAAMSASGRSMPQPTFTNSTPAAPASPLSGSHHVPVNVGNASLQALRASGPAKFACVLLVGMPRVGKTTIGRELVYQLQQDDLYWGFFSGGDFLRDTPTRPAPWDTTKDVYDALSRKIDELQADAHKTKIKGLIIDKQCRGTEELYYLTALLRSKGLHLNGVVGLVADDDTKLMDRLGETDIGFREKCKFHRVIQTRIREASKAAGLWHPVDALQDRDFVVRRVRSMVLGCSSQQPHKQLSAHNYHEGLSTMVDNYETYAKVMGELTKLARMPKASQFPGFTNLTPLPQQVLNKKAALKDYAIRRRSDGTKYVLLYDGSTMYLVPRHMRCVFQLKNEAWLGIPLNTVGKFVLDGDLVRLSKERGKEKFLVQDVICWHEKANPSVNMVARLSWADRQERLKQNICGETSAFYSNSDIVIAHQTFVDIKDAVELFDTCDYSTDGFVFHPKAKRDDPVYFWRSPENVMVDFRLGAGTPTGEGTKRYLLQVFDQRQAKFVEYGTDTVTVQENRQFVVEGALVVCTLKPDEAAKSEGREWQYVRTRTDIATSAFKSYVDDLLTNCLIPKSAIQTFLDIDRPSQTTNSVPGTAATSTTGPGSVQPLGAASTASASVVPNPSFQHQRGVFGSALTSADSANLVSTVPVGQPAGALSQLEHVVRGTVHAQPATAAEVVAGTRRPTAEASAGRDRLLDMPEHERRERPPRKDRGPPKKKCNDCGQYAEGEADSGNHLFYCFACWEIFEADQKNKKRGGGRHESSNKAGRDRSKRENGGERNHRERGDGKSTKANDEKSRGQKASDEEKNSRRPRRGSGKRNAPPAHDAPAESQARRSGSADAPAGKTQPADTAVASVPVQATA